MSNMETKVGTTSKKMKPAVKRQVVSGKCHKSKLYNNTNDEKLYVFLQKLNVKKVSIS